MRNKDRNFPSRKDDYHESIFNKLNQVLSLEKHLIAQGQEVGGLLISGDIFDIPAPSSNSHELVNKVIELLNEFSSVLAISGNHDLKFKSLDLLREQPIFSLFLSGIHNLDEKPFFITNSQGKVIKISGFSYREERPLNYLKMIDKEECDYCIALAHLYAADISSIFFGEKIYAFKDLANLGNWDVLCLGHYHENFGFREINGRYISAPGALSRGTFTKENIDRKVSVNIISINTGIKIFTKDLKITPADQIFDFQSKEDKIINDKNILDYISDLKKDISGDFLDIDKIEKRSDIDNEVKKKIIYYLGQAK